MISQDFLDKRRRKEEAVAEGRRKRIVLVLIFSKYIGQLFIILYFFCKLFIILTYSCQFLDKNLILTKTPNFTPPNCKPILINISLKS